MKSKKKVLGVLNWSFLSSLVGGSNSLFKFFKKGDLKKKSLGNPALETFYRLYREFRKIKNTTAFCALDSVN